MGGTLRKQVEGLPPEGPIADIMRDKYGPDSVSLLNCWRDNFGFPPNGSLSKQKVDDLEKRLNNVEKKMKKKKKVKTNDLKLMDKHRRILQCCKNESEWRERKQMIKQLPLNEKGHEQGQKNVPCSLSLLCIRS